METNLDSLQYLILLNLFIYNPLFNIISPLKIIKDIFISPAYTVCLDLQCPFLFTSINLYGGVRSNPTFYNYRILYHNPEININRLLLHTPSSYNYYILYLNLDLQTIQLLLVMVPQKFSLLADNANPINTMPISITHLNKPVVSCNSYIFIEKDLVLLLFSEVNKILNMWTSMVDNTKSHLQVSVCGGVVLEGKRKDLDLNRKVLSKRVKLGNLRKTSAIQKREFSTSSPLRSPDEDELVSTCISLVSNLRAIRKLEKQTDMSDYVRKFLPIYKKDANEIVVSISNILKRSSVIDLDGLQELVYTLVTEGPKSIIQLVIGILTSDPEQVLTGLSTLLPLLFKLLLKTYFFFWRGKQPSIDNLDDSPKDSPKLVGGNYIKDFSRRSKLANLRFKGNCQILKRKFSTCSSNKAPKAEDLNVLNNTTTLNCFQSKGDTDRTR